MCPDKSSAILRSQQGFLLPIAMFILVALGALALTVARFSGQASIAGVQEGVSLQAFYAAESGAQYAMSQLYYVASGGSAIDRVAVATNCASVNGDTINFSGAGLNNCSTSIVCSASSDAGSATSFFTIASAAVCGVGEVSASRTLEVSSFIRDGT